MMRKSAAIRVTLAVLAAAAGTACVGVPPSQRLTRPATFSELRWTMTGAGTVKREDDVVTLEGGPGALVVALEHADYRVRVDVWVEPGGNSGIFVRGKDGIWFPDGVEIQINPADTNNPTGSVYGRVKSHAPAPRFGEWFTVEIVVSGERVESRVNGIVAAVVEDAPADGPLFALQLHYPGSVVRYRNLVIEPL